MSREIELLAPAKSAEIGKLAIDYGADAVYIGAPKFGARAAAGNELADLADLVQYAHRFHAKVYVTLNTIIYEDELAEVEALIHDLHGIGVDALIVQDMAILEMNLPDIALHASTQCDNRDVDKVRFLEQAGFEQVVLARELSLPQITEIASQAQAKIECFIHGALCVSYSGQCYMSQAMGGRSANRGSCAQWCRLPYTLLDANDKVIVKDKHLLSLKDFDASAQLSAMLDAGVSSFKIEGRLKDANYVKNITAHYRKLLDSLLPGKGLKRASMGSTQFSFEPNPEKSFYRGGTSYFLEGREPELVTMDTPKSLGEYVGKVKWLRGNSFELYDSKEVHNGDGLCGLDKNGDFIGFRINKVEGRKHYTLKPVNVHQGMSLYRNYDIQFDKMMEQKQSKRTISVDFKLTDSEDGICVSLTNERGICVQRCYPQKKEPAKNVEKMADTFRQQLSKMGETNYAVCRVELDFEQMWFVPVSQLNEWRRELVQLLQVRELECYVPNGRQKSEGELHLQADKLDYRGNVSNSLAERFYKRCGVEMVQPAFERESVPDAELMRTKFCLKHELKLCPKQRPTTAVAEPLQLKHGDERFTLHFDCGACEMVIKRGMQ